MGAQVSIPRQSKSVRETNRNSDTNKIPLTPKTQNKIFEFKRIVDSFETYEEVQQGLQKAGLECSQLIVGIDFTKSNEWTGRMSFEGKCLHDIDSRKFNPYEEALTYIAKTLSKFDDDNKIPCYGFGDVTTHDYGVFSFFENDRPANGLEELVNKYRSIAPYIKLSGPTSFAPLIHQAMRIVIEDNYSYHILLIIADGTVTENCLHASIEALVAASKLPLSIIMVGVGDGPWDTMRYFDDQITNRVFDNFQFVEFNKILMQSSVYGDNFEKKGAHFAVHALMEIPEQYKIVQSIGLVNPKNIPFKIDYNRKLVYPLPVPHDTMIQHTYNNFPYSSASAPPAKF